MNAKYRNDFIKTPANEANIPCPACGKFNNPEDGFCIFCGEDLPVSKRVQNNVPAFAPTDESSGKETSVKESSDNELPVETEKAEFYVLKTTQGDNKSSVKDVKYVEPNNVFAQGLPDWSIEPPQVVVRRR